MSGASELNEGVWYMAACSGLWYRNPDAAGDISLVMVNGIKFVRDIREFPYQIIDENRGMAPLEKAWGEWEAEAEGRDK